MISVEQATQIILENAPSRGEEETPLLHSTGRVLRENLTADRDFPPFDRVTMDGIAIRFENFQNGQRSFPVEGLQAAGAPQLTLSQPTHCLEVMTGAMLPKGTDAVIRYEDLALKNGQATLLTDAIQVRQNIHPTGIDRKKGDVIVRAGSVISPAEIGVAATIGKANLRVAGLPKIAVISTGDELVEVHETPLAHQIRRSNAYSLAAALGTWGIEATMLHLPDEAAAMERILKEALENYDAILLSGGVSEGRLDFVPKVLAKLGVERLFHKVSQRPGKPFWFGALPETSGRATVVFAFPGNPVSTFMCLHRYFQPWLRAGLGLQPIVFQYAALEEDFFFKPDLTYFLQVKTTFRADGQLSAKPVAGGGSGDLANLADADAFLELPLEQQSFQKGDVFPVIRFRSWQ